MLQLTSWESQPHSISDSPTHGCKEDQDIARLSFPAQQKHKNSSLYCRNGHCTKDSAGSVDGDPAKHKTWEGHAEPPRHHCQADKTNANTLRDEML